MVEPGGRGPPRAGGQPVVEAIPAEELGLDHDLDVDRPPAAREGRTPSGLDLAHEPRRHSFAAEAAAHEAKILHEQEAAVAAAAAPREPSSAWRLASSPFLLTFGLLAAGIAWRLRAGTKPEALWLPALVALSLLVLWIDLRGKARLRKPLLGAMLLGLLALGAADGLAAIGIFPAAERAWTFVALGTLATLGEVLLLWGWPSRARAIAGCLLLLAPAITLGALLLGTAVAPPSVAQVAQRAAAAVIAQTGRPLEAHTLRGRTVPYCIAQFPAGWVEAPSAVPPQPMVDRILMHEGKGSLLLVLAAKAPGADPIDEEASFQALLDSSRGSPAFQLVSQEQFADGRAYLAHRRIGAARFEEFTWIHGLGDRLVGLRLFAPELSAQMDVAQVRGMAERVALRCR